MTWDRSDLAGGDSTPAGLPPSMDQAQQAIKRALAEDRLRLTGEAAAALLETYARAAASASQDKWIGEFQSAGQALSMGMMEDDIFGPLIYFGHGGSAARIIQDQALALPPLNMKLARDLMRQTRVFSLLFGSGDAAAAEMESIAFALVKLSQLVSDQPAIRAIHLNPLIAGAQGVIILAASIELSAPKVPPERQMAICAYPKQLESSIILPDGRALLLRPVRPEDAPAFQEIFESLTPESIRFRFLHPMNLLPHKEAARLTQIDYDREMALVLDGQGEDGKPQLFGSVRISTDPDPTSAEYAILLRSNMTGMGLGPMLMRRIIEYARSRGIRQIHADVLDDNRSMLSLCKTLGFKQKRDLDDPGVVKVSLDLNTSQTA
jgi:acetyltransferase